MGRWVDETMCYIAGMTGTFVIAIDRVKNLVGNKKQLLGLS